MDSCIWSGWDNVESDPEMGNLVQVLRLENGAEYEFDTFIVWKSADDGRYYWAWDSGCSCPTPFEGIDNLSHLNSGPKSRAVEAAESWVNSRDDWEDGRLRKIDLMSRVRDFKRRRIPAVTIEKKIDPYDLTF